MKLVAGRPMKGLGLMSRYSKPDLVDFPNPRLSSSVSGDMLGAVVHTS